MSLPRNLCWIVLTASCLGACAPDEALLESIPSDEVVEASGSLFAIPAESRWPKPARIEACFISTAFPAEREVIQRAIQDTWLKWADITVTFSAPCPTTGTDRRVRIELENSGGSGSGASASLGIAANRLPTEPRSMHISFSAETNVATGARVSQLQYYAVHEFGHVLGFEHEQDRRDNPELGTESSQYCQGSQFSGENITPFDRASVMHYCGTYAGALSHGDIDGVVSVYGPRRVVLQGPEERSLFLFAPRSTFVRHQNGLGATSPQVSYLDKDDAAFRVRPGLASSSCVSFESRNYPNSYLRHEGFRVTLSPFTDTDLFRADATFCQRAPLAVTGEAGFMSFASYNFQDYYLRNRKGELWLEWAYGGAMLVWDGTFGVTYARPSTPAVVRGQRYALQSYNYPARRVVLQNGGVRIEQGTQTWRVVNGLADSRCVSFESTSSPGQFLRHSNFRVVQAASDGSQLFREDATFCPRAAPGGFDWVQLESFNYPGRFLRHYAFEMFISPVSTDITVKDSTFRFLL